MADDLEKYISAKRKDLDVEVPPASVWENINRSEGFESAPARSFTWMWKAATIALLMISSLLIYVLVQDQNTQDQLLTLGDISEEYRLVQMEYERSIGDLSQSIELEKLDKSEFGWLIEELEYLDDINEKFREDISKKVNQELLIKALVDYYEKKLKLLRRLELEINRKNNEKGQIINT